MARRTLVDIKWEIMRDMTLLDQRSPFSVDLTFEQRMKRVFERVPGHLTSLPQVLLPQAGASSAGGTEPVLPKQTETLISID